MKTPDRKRLEEIMGQFMNEAIALHRISGAEIKILQNDEPLLEAVYGNKNLKKPLWQPWNETEEKGTENEMP
ncbi:MAG: hypothetical protein IJK34_08925 [Clostridia bacterium]|nr:hypothetical protein [Clostridia bacterium]